ncbi:MAG: pyridoxal-phosphate dependent enzyme [Candidatus Latescibacterota bacterium]|nr:MAG: pyridoxal-phosphate dependent enzyme [Candidatus Latescibacterota bacterium]
MATVPTINDIETAAKRIGSYVHRTPVLTSRAINRMCDAALYFKCENFQRVGAFKIRGATNAVFSLRDDEACTGVATHSSGNHAAALALAARWKGIHAHVVMPDNAPRVKIDAVRGYGAEIVFCEPTLEAREATLAEVVAKTGATVIHPYNDLRVIAGQGTATLELISDVADLEAILAPVGGGGLLSGTAIAAAALSPRTRVFGCEPEGADDARRSFESGSWVPSVSPDTIADGLLTSLGDLTFPIILRHVAGIITVDDEGIAHAMRLVWERMKIVIEPSAAVPLAALMKHRSAVRGRRVGILLSGGNVELDRLPWVVESFAKAED